MTRDFLDTFWTSLIFGSRKVNGFFRKYMQTKYENLTNSRKLLCTYQRFLRYFRYFKKIHRKHKLNNFLEEDIDSTSSSLISCPYYTLDDTRSWRYFNFDTLWFMRILTGYLFKIIICMIKSIDSKHKGAFGCYVRD